MTWPIDRFYIVQTYDEDYGKWTTMMRIKNKEELHKYWLHALQSYGNRQIRTAKAFSFRTPEGELKIKEIEILHYYKGAQQ